LLDSATRIVVFGFGRPLQWLPRQRAHVLWQSICRHFEVPGAHGAEPDAEGLTYAAVIWQRGNERLLGIQVFC
jgi:hypothetical protein